MGQEGVYGVGDGDEERVCGANDEADRWLFVGLIGEARSWGNDGCGDFKGLVMCLDVR